MPRLRVAGLDVEPGNRATGVAEVSIGGRCVSVPVIAVNGAGDGPRVAVTGGIHGAEYVAIEAARRLGMSVDPRELRGSLVVVPVSNTTSFFRRTVYRSGLDEQNLNRVFPGDPGGSPSQILASWLFQNIIQPSDFYVDMHGGDMIEALVPFVLWPRCPDPSVEEASRGMAVASGIPRIIHGGVEGSTCGAAVAAGIPSILAEIGGQGVWSREEVSAHQDSTTRVLRHLGVLPGDPIAGERQHVYDRFDWMRSDVDGLFQPAVRVGEEVRKGQSLGAVVDYFGEPLQPVKAVLAGEVVFLVTSLAINAGDPLLAICA